MTSFANAGNYWDIDIPILPGAKNIKKEKDARFFQISVEYEIEVKDSSEIYAFYNTFFEKMGWENPMKKYRGHSGEFKGNWSSHQMAFTSEGSPFAAYAGMWKANDIPALGSVNLTMDEYNGDVFGAKLRIVLTPEVDRSPLMKIQQLMTGNPKNIFKLHEAIGGNPFELDKINLSMNPGFKNEKVVVDFYKSVDEVMNNYADFGKKYVK